MISIFFLKAVLMSVLPFYRVGFPVHKIPKQFTYVEYDNGRATEEHLVKEGDDTYVSLNNLLTRERAGWRYDFNTYANARVFSSHVMTINCLKNALIVNYEDQDDAQWVQMSKDVKETCPAFQG